MSTVLAAQADSLDWTAVASSNVDAVAYARDFGLFVRFRGGARYLYKGVEPEVWAELLAAPSKGQFVYDRVRGAAGRRGLGGGAPDNRYATYGPF